MALSQRKKSVVDHYLQGLSKVDAMKKAGYSDSTAQTKHSAVFGDPEVKKEIERRQKIQSSRSDITFEYLTNKLKEIVDANLGDLIEFGEDGTPWINYEKLTPQLRTALSNFSVDEVTEGRGESARKVKRIRVGTLDKLRAIELLIRHLGLSKEKVVVSVEEDLVERLQRGRARSGLS